MSSENKLLEQCDLSMDVDEQYVLPSAKPPRRIAKPVSKLNKGNKILSLSKNVSSYGREIKKNEPKDYSFLGEAQYPSADRKRKRKLLEENDPPSEQKTKKPKESVSEPQSPVATKARIPLSEMQSPEIDVRIRRLYDKAREDGIYSAEKKRLAAKHYIGRFGEKVKSVIMSGESFMQEILAHGAELSSLDKPAEIPPGRKVHVLSSSIIMGRLETAVRVLGKHWYLNGLTGAQVTGIKDYKKIAQQLDELTIKVPDAAVAQTIWQTLHDKPLEHKNLFTKKDLSLIGNVAYLLFAIESVRDPGALIINAMFLDLVSNGTIEMNYIKKLPMSIKGAKGVMRAWAEFTEDDAIHAPIKGDPSLKDQKVGELLDRYQSLVENWLELRFPGMNLHLSKDMEKIITVIYESIGPWFGVEIKPPRLSSASEFAGEISPIAYSPDTDDDVLSMGSGSSASELDSYNLC